MKKILLILCGVLVLNSLGSCDSNSNDDLPTMVIPVKPNPIGTPQPDPQETPSETNIYFGFLDGDGSSETYIDMPIESSTENLIVGRWKIVKLGVDENNDGKIQFYNYKDFEHEVCGESFLQFNNDGVVFENSYYKQNSICTLFVEIDTWEFIEENRLKIYVYDIIYLIEVTQSQLVLKYDWRFENSLWAPLQVYYYFERIVE